MSESIYSVEAGDFESLKDRFANIVPIDSDGLLSEEELMRAVRSGDRARVLELLSRNCPMDERAAAIAAEMGRIDLLEMLVERGAPVSVWACSYAARNDQRVAIQWLRQRGYPWDESSPAHAAACGHLGLIQYLHQQGCPIDEQAYLNAKRLGRTEIATWLEKAGCPQMVPDGQSYTGEVLNAGVIQGVIDSHGYLISSRSKGGT
jgi:hypothetical protein